MKHISPMIFVTSVISASSTYFSFLVRDNHCFLILSCVISSPAATAAFEWFQAMTPSHLQFTRNCYVHTLSTEKQHLYSFAVLVIAVVVVEKSVLDNEEYRVFAQHVANIKSWSEKKLNEFCSPTLWMGKLRLMDVKLSTQNHMHSLLMAEQNQDQRPKIRNSSLVFFSLFAFTIIHYLPKTL